MSVALRQRIERTIAERIITDALAAGYTISVDDSEEVVLVKSSDPEEILKAMFTTDNDALTFHKKGERTKWVHLVYGNDGHDVISDCTISAEELLAGAEKLADDIAEGKIKIEGL